VIDLAAIAAPEWVETAGLGRLDFGCCALSPADFDRHAGTLFGLVAGVGQETAAREATPADLEHIQILACLTVRQVRKPGEDPQPLRLVLAETDEDTAAGRLWVGRLPVEDVAHIAGAGVRRYVEAAARAARFRRGSEAAPHDGRDGEAVRDDPGAVAVQAAG